MDSWVYTRQVAKDYARDLSDFPDKTSSEKAFRTWFGEHGLIALVQRSKKLELWLHALDSKRTDNVGRPIRCIAYLSTESPREKKGLRNFFSLLLTDGKMLKSTEAAIREDAAKIDRKTPESSEFPDAEKLLSLASNTDPFSGSDSSDRLQQIDGDNPDNRCKMAKLCTGDDRWRRLMVGKGRSVPQEFRNDKDTYMLLPQETVDEYRKKSSPPDVGWRGLGKRLTGRNSRLPVLVVLALLGTNTVWLNLHVAKQEDRLAELQEQIRKNHIDIDIKWNSLATEIASIQENRRRLLDEVRQMKELAGAGDQKRHQMETQIQQLASELRQLKEMDKTDVSDGVSDEDTSVDGSENPVIGEEEVQNRP